MHQHWFKKIVEDIHKQKVLECYELKNKMSLCIKKNEGNIESCIEFRTDFEDCLQIIEKRMKTQKKTIHTDLSSLYN